MNKYCYYSIIILACVDTYILVLGLAFPTMGFQTSGDPQNYNEGLLADRECRPLKSLIFML